MGFIRKGLLVFLVGLVSFVGLNVYRILTFSHTTWDIAPTDLVWSSEMYKKHFGDREWAATPSFAVVAGIPLSDVRPELLEDDRLFAAEALRLAWNSRVHTQSNGPPIAAAPVLGDQSASDSIRAEIVDVNLESMYMALTITTVPTGFTGGLEVVEVRLNRAQGFAGIMFKYVWHNDAVLLHKWSQSLGIWMQVLGRRLWLMDIMAGLTKGKEVDARLMEGAKLKRAEL